MLEDQEIKEEQLKLYRKNALGTALMAFSPWRNFTKLFVIRKFGPTRFTNREENKFEKHMQLLDGVRVICLFWIILGNTYIYATMTATQNPFIADEYFKQPLFTIVIGANTAVDIFFFLSAFLGAFSFLRIKRTSCGLFLKAYGHRLFRVLPVYAFVLMLGYYLVYLPGDGVVWSLYRNAWADCGTWWWTNLLFINNLYPLHLGNTCMPWTWYLASDM